MGGRWNSRGRVMVYTSEHRSLAALETLVHIPRAQLLRDAFAIVGVEVPDDLVEDLDPRALPPGWNDPQDARATRALGDAWLDERASVALRVPSAVIPREFNLLLAPEHPDWGRVAIGEAETFLFDLRLTSASRRA